MSEEIENKDYIESLITNIVSNIDKVPAPIKNQLNDFVAQIKDMLLNSRPPRILIIGRRGAGKSSLVNAIFNQRIAEIGAVESKTGCAEWHSYTSPLGILDILDTRGMGDATRPETAEFDSWMDDLKKGIESQCPDAVLFLCKAKETDARIADDLIELQGVIDFANKKYNYLLPLITVVTQIDELDPKRAGKPYDHPEKRKNIDDACKAVENVFKKHCIEPIDIIPVSTYMEYESTNKYAKIVYDENYNIDNLVMLLINELPKSASLQLARLSKLTGVQKKLAKTIVQSTAIFCSGLAATPIPVADIYFITTAQIAMITAIAYISGKELSEDSAKEFLSAAGLNVGTAFALREAARQLVKLLPIAGEVISAGMAYAGTQAVGTLAISYYIEKKSMDEARKDSAKRQKEAELEYKDKDGNLLT